MDVETPRIIVIIHVLPVDTFQDPSIEPSTVVEVELCLRVLVKVVPVYRIVKRPFPRFIAEL